MKSLSKKVEPIIREGLVKFTDETGRLWTSLADYFIRMGHFEKARDIFEEGISTVTTVRDFSMIFEAYAQFEESMVPPVPPANACMRKRVHTRTYACVQVCASRRKRTYLCIERTQAFRRGIHTCAYVCASAHECTRAHRWACLAMCALTHWRAQACMCAVASMHVHAYRTHPGTHVHASMHGATSASVRV